MTFDKYHLDSSLHLWNIGEPLGKSSVLHNCAYFSHLLFAGLTYGGMDPFASHIHSDLRVTTIFRSLIISDP